MCLILFSHRYHAGRPLVVAANRDEFFRRPTAPAEFWPDAPDILAGRDRSHGGTWLGVTRSGRLAALTNYREPGRQDPNAPSRGMLVSDFLRSEVPAFDYAAAVHSRGTRFNGFNLIVFDGETVCYVSNRAPAPLILAPGIYGISNHLLDTPWPKVAGGKAALARIKDADLTGQLFEILYDPTPAADERLPATGLTLERERAVSAAHILPASGAGGDAAYGTRCATAVVIEADGMIDFSERTFTESGEISAVSAERFPMNILR